MNRILRRTLKILGWTGLSLVLLLVLVAVLVQVPSVQNFIRGKAVAYIENKIGTRVEIGYLRIKFPKTVVLGDVYFEDQKKDTLLYGKKLLVDLNMMKLLKSEVQINDLQLENINARIYRRGADTIFNYQYIVDAFSKPSTKQKQDSSANLGIDIRHVRLQQVRALFADDQSGADMYVGIGDFETDIKHFDLDSLSFRIPDIRLENTAARIYQHKPLVEPRTEAEVVAANKAPIKMKLDLGRLHLKNVSMDFGNDVSALTTNTRIGELLLEPEMINLQTLSIRLKNLKLHNTSTAIVLGPTAAAEEVEQQAEAAVEAQASNPWKIELQTLDLQDNDLLFDNNTQARIPLGMDYAHLKLMNFSLVATGLAFTPSIYTGTIDSAHFREENSRFALQELHTKFLYHDQGVTLNELYLRSDRTVLRDKIVVTWPSLERLVSAPGELGLQANLVNSRVSFRDIITFAPMVAAQPPFKGSPDAVFDVSTQFSGPLKALTIQRFEARGRGGGFNNTYARLSGSIIGLPDPIRTVYNFNIAEARTTSAELNRLLPPGTIPPTIQLPESIAATGTFNGSMTDFRTAMNVSTNRGAATVAGSIRGMGTSYDLKANLSNLDIGFIMKQQATIGRVSGVASIRGSGFDPNTMVADVRADLSSIGLSGYNYRNVSVTARLDHGNTDAVASIRDPNLHADINLAGLMKGEYPALKADISLDSLNLGALGFYSGNLKLHGRIIADLNSTDPDALDGTIRIMNLIVNNEGHRYAASDTIAIDAYASGADRRIVINSEALIADLHGQYRLTQLAPAILATVNKYYATPGYRPAPYGPQQFNLTASFRPSPLLFAFVPEMQGSDSIQAVVAFNSSSDQLDITGSAPKIVYGTTSMDSLTLRAASAGEALRYNVSLEAIDNPSLHLDRTLVGGDIRNNNLNTDVAISDREDRQRYGFGATVQALPADAYRVSLKEGLMLNYDNWSVQPANYIQYSPQGLIIQNFGISNGTQLLTANSAAPVVTAPIDVAFTNFRIGTITEMAGQDSLLADGLINGVATLENVMSGAPVFTSDLGITDLSYKQDTVGNLTVKVNNQTANTLAADIRLLGKGNDVQLAGTYGISSSSMDMSLNIAALNLATIVPFTVGQVSDAHGYMRGQFDVNGTLTAPKVDGTVHFDSAYITPMVLGERFALNSRPLSVNATGIHFDDFVITDSALNTATLDGDILTTDFKDYKFALDFNANDFRAVNAKRRPNSDQMFYGLLNLTTQTRIRGDFNLPVVNSYLRINAPTRFSYILPTGNPEVQSREGVVKFVDMDRPDDTAIFPVRDSSAQVAAMKGIDLDATIETDTGADFRIVIDDRNGDAINIRGAASLNAGVDPSGKITLTGPFVLTEGSYLLTLNLLQRRFSIQSGSTLTWMGDPLTATADITAVYVANTSPLELLEHQLAGRDQNEINKYKQRLPFNVLLRMQGELLKPVITFDIILPERDATTWKEVDLKLAQIRSDESELNKQVFALLLLNRFVNENPLQGSASGGPVAEAFLRQSASRILTDQLNKLAGNIINGFELNFGVTSGDDYTTGQLQQRTDLTVGVSKRLLNDRLRVNVGSAFQVEGPQGNSSSASNIAGDVALDYQLTRDGRYLVRAYRRNLYESLTEGQVVETGASFIYRLDYDKFRDFFRRPKAKATSTAK